jgi:hypothetical protein
LPVIAIAISVARRLEDFPTLHTAEIEFVIMVETLKKLRAALRNEIEMEPRFGDNFSFTQVMLPT